MSAQDRPFLLPTSVAARTAHYLRSPLTWILAVSLLLRVAGIIWGLPSADGWDEDGVAPRNFLVGLAETYAPGSFFTYPPFHMLILAIPTLPGLVIAIFRAHSFSRHDVIAEFIQVPYMTYFSVVARLISVTLSLGTIVVVGKITEAIAGWRAGILASLACALNAQLIYYGSQTNLDGPYIFWCVVSVWALTRTIAEHDPRQIKWAALSAAAAIATKDQAYAVFLFAIPAVGVLWFALDDWPRRNAGAVGIEALRWGAISLAALLLIDGAITNPAGFAKRVAFLIGPASQDYKEYSNDWAGRLALLGAAARRTNLFYPIAAALLAPLGFLLQALRTLRSDEPKFVASLVPLLGAVSFTIGFNFIALRTDARFLLPQAVFASVYLGIAADTLLSRLPWRAAGQAAGVALVLLGAIALYNCLAIDAAFLDDPRYDTEKWLSAHAGAGHTIEAYGLNAYLPRFPGGTAVTRLDGKPISARNPLPGVVESNAPYADVPVRRPDFLVVSGLWLDDFLGWNRATGISGQVQPPVQKRTAANAAAQQYFRALFAGELHYRLVHSSVANAEFRPQADGNSTLDQPVYIFERASTY